MWEAAQFYLVVQERQNFRHPLGPHLRLFGGVKSIMIDMVDEISGETENNTLAFVKSLTFQSA